MAITKHVQKIVDRHKNKKEEDSLRNALADYAHEAWAGWMKYMFKQGTFNDDGTWTMPKESAERWQRQMATDYKKLPKDEQKSDIEQAEKILKIINK